MSRPLKEQSISTCSYEFPILFHFIWCWERLWYAGSANRVIIVVVHLMSFLLRPGWREVVGVGLGISRPKRRWKTGRCTDGGKRCESTVVFDGWKRFNHWNQSSHGRFEVSKIPTVNMKHNLHGIVAMSIFLNGSVSWNRDTVKKKERVPALQAFIFVQRVWLNCLFLCLFH